MGADIKNNGNPTVIKVSKVSMKYRLNKEKIDSLKEYCIKLVKREIAYREFWAVRDVSFDVFKGETFGIIGLNGAGKSTLLKMIAGVVNPTEGSIKVNGNLVPLLELGVGFDMQLTARENIFLNGAMLGRKRDFLESKFDDIIDFSELHDFVDVPIKNYSSGMRARLGFAIATAVNPDILIVDEALSVGDFKFQEKCRNKIESIRKSGATVLFVSHGIKQVQEMCERVLWLEKGRIRAVGLSKEVCEKFLNDKKAPPPRPVPSIRYKTRRFR